MIFAHCVPRSGLTGHPRSFRRTRTSRLFKHAALLEQSGALESYPAQFTKLMDINNSFPFRAQDFDLQKFVDSAKVGKKAGRRALGRDALPIWKDFFAHRQPQQP